MNPQDSNVDGEIAENPIAPPAEITPPEESSDVNPQGASTTNPEEVAWNSLKGGTQDRIKQLIHERDQERAEKSRLEQYVQYSNTPQTYPAPPQQYPGQSQPEVRDAVRKLEEVGIATDAKVEAKINQRMGDLIYNMEMQRLESQFSGEDGKTPRFDRGEYEDFVMKNPKYRSYDPVDVYKHHMYPEEIADAMNSRASGTSSTPSLKPTKTVVREEQWTPDWIEGRMKQADGLQWYAKNKEKVNNYLSKL